MAAASDLDGTVNGDRLFIRDIRDRLRQRFPECVIVLIPEQNLGKEASHIEEYIRGYRVVTMVEGKKHGTWFGVRKTDTVTVDMQKKMSSMLSSGTIAIAENCIGIPSLPIQKKHPTLVPGSAPASAFMLDELRKQMRSYRWAETNTNRRTDFTEATYKLTGKRSNQQDDHVICANMIGYWRDRFWMSSNPEYTKAKEWMGVHAGLSLQPSLGGLGGPTSTVNLTLDRNPR